MRASPNRLLATIFGAAYLLIGIAGFFVTSGLPIAGTSGGLLLGLFEVNVLHNAVHLLIGAALLLAGLSSVRASRTVTTVIGAASLLLGLIGLFVIGSAFNILALNGADNVLYFASAVVLLAVGLGADRSAPAAPAATA
jgi:hypothetical protein